MLGFETYIAARFRRDPSFAGRFFTAVRTTRTYCRPVWPATAPFCAAWNGTKPAIERVLRLIQEGALDDATGSELADRLGVGARHLSHVIVLHIGATPFQTAKTHRIAHAKKRLDTRTLSITKTAFQAGSGSVCRLNAAFSKLDGRSPSLIRRPKR